MGPSPTEMDDSGLANCVVFSCQRPAVKDMAYCTAHLSMIPAPSPPAPVDDSPLPDPTPPDPTAMEPHWDGGQWVLRPKGTETRDLVRTLKNVRGIVKELMAELEIWEESRE
jgi:hypothetical protein